MAEYKVEDVINGLDKFHDRILDTKLASLVTKEEMLWIVRAKAFLRHYSTADVVPKSEVDKLSHKCDECAGCTQWKCDCANIELEVAMEFFEEIDSILFLHERSHMPFSGNDYVNYYDISLKKDIERLKDKCIKNSQSL